VTASGHHYNVETIQKAVKQTIDSGSSLRGVEKNLKLDVSNEGISTPSFSSVRNWLGRIGLYELQREKEYRTDWIFIIDLTVELGKQKCLVVLGVSQQYLAEFELEKFALFSNKTLVFQQSIIEYITIEIEKIPEGKTILATSDIIESIFGKYKHFSSRCPLKQIGQMILSISLCTMNLATWGFLYKPSKRGILEINETGLGLAAERLHRDRSSQKTS
jgi:hypothetical protein